MHPIIIMALKPERRAMKGEKLSFVATDVSIDKQRNDEQFATLHVNAFASGHNLNNTYISDETLQKTAWTILDKPLLWAYDKKIDDAGTHERNEVPCGFVPSSNNSLSFTTLEDGRTMLSVVAKIWKYYSGFLMDFFKRDNGQKPVSVELEVLDSNRREDGSWELSDYAYTGITILGTKVMPAIPGAKALVLNFSDAEKEYNKAYENEVSKLNVAASKIMEEGDSIVDIENKEFHDELEESIERQSELNESLPEEQDITPEDIDKKQDSFEALSDESNEVNEIESEPEKTVEESPLDLVDEPENEQPSQPKLPFQEILEHFSDVQGISELFDSENYSGVIEFLYGQILDSEKQLSTYKQEVVELQQFKSEIDKTRLEKEINETMEIVRESLSEDESSILFEASKKYNVDNIDVWKNEVMAAAYKASLTNKPKAKSDMSASLPEKKEKKNGVKLLW